MNSPSQRDSRAVKRRLLRLSACLAVAVVATILAVCDPETWRYYPRCLSYRLFGLQCASCGILRATHALLHGDVAEAFRFNPVFTVATPVAFGWMAARRLRRLVGRQPPPISLGRWVIPVVVALLLVYTALRNIPWRPFGWLRAPEPLDQSAMPQ